MPLRGADELRAKLADFRKNAVPATGAALYEEAIAAIGKADKDVPYEFGHLRRSHFVELPKDGPTGPTVEFGYGAGYGLYVHEVPANHPKGGKDHFLRDACVERMSGISARLAKRIEAHLASGTGIAPLGVPTVRPDPMEAILAGKINAD